ncbi:MAG: ECF transporter S component [Clostridia bacterium]|nr:ECF transporter S component [Clostridia bacterium]
MKKKLSVKKTVYTALFAAIVFVCTVVVHIHIPIPGAVGYVSLGDCAVIICGLILGPIYGGLAAGIGSALADALYSHWLYVPASFVIKLLMAVCAYFVYKAICKEIDSYKIIPLTVASIVSECIMIFGYLVYEATLYTFATAFLGVIPHCIQGVSSAILAILLLQIMKKTNLTD